MEQNILYSILFIILFVCIFYYRKIYEKFEEDDIIKFTLSNSDKSRFLNYKNDKLVFNNNSSTTFQITKKQNEDDIFPLMIGDDYLQGKLTDDGYVYYLGEKKSAYTVFKYNVEKKTVQLGSKYIDSNDSYDNVSYDNNGVSLKMNKL